MISPDQPIAGDAEIAEDAARVGSAREERLLLLLSIFVGVISGLLVVSFRMAIAWLSVLLLGSSPQPHQMRLLWVPAAAGSDATPAPICSEGSSGPSEWPLPIASAETRNLPITVLLEMYPLLM